MSLAGAVLPWPHAADHAVLSHPAGGRRRPSSLVLRTETGDVLPFDLARWHAPASDEERALLTTLDGPVIDLGCGPGRVVVDLLERGIRAMGVDSSPFAVASARRRGAAAVRADLFGPLPDEGRWAAALLFDGTIGIGGDPLRLLTRCREIVCATGSVLAEVEPPGTGCRRMTAWFERDGEAGRPFPWAVVGADAISGLAAGAGFGPTGLSQTRSGRWFAHLQVARR